MSTRGSTCRVRELGAQGDGKRDDTAALQAAFDRAAELGEGVVLVSPGVYRVRETLSFRADGCQLLGVGQPTILADELLPRILDSDGRSQLRIAGLRVRGTGVHDVGGRGAIHLDERSTACTVENTEVHDAPGTGIVDDGAGNTIRGNVVRGTGEHGIYVSGCRHGVYSANRITGAGEVHGATLLAHGLSIADASECRIVDNLVEGGRGLGLVLRDGAHDNVVSGNTVRGTGDRLLLIGSGSRNLLCDNRLEQPPPGRDALQVTGGGSNRIERNFIRVTTSGSAALRWVGDEPSGGDLVKGNVVLLDGKAVDYHTVELDAPRAGPVLLIDNTIQAVRLAAPASAVRRRSGRAPQLEGNLVQDDRHARTLGAGVHHVERTDLALRCDPRQGSVHVMLPAAGVSRWRTIAIGRPASGYPVVVQGDGDDRIAGERVLSLPPGRARLYLQCDGGGWHILL
ncbi:MAG TPA: right-handed parallel beta-helix repeat-containing protein [Gemmatimonadales bacterium]|nr:right-handed parallel beta-helix repeat-containing protein [Gemmatimonadales bacterium]